MIIFIWLYACASMCFMCAGKYIHTYVHTCAYMYTTLDVDKYSVAICPGEPMHLVSLVLVLVQLFYCLRVLRQRCSSSEELQGSCLRYNPKAVTQQEKFNLNFFLCKTVFYSNPFCSTPFSGLSSLPRRITTLLTFQES